MLVRNGRHFTEAAINSILDQSFKDFEFLIIDDASEDNTYQIIKSYRKRYSKLIRIFRLSKNLGAFGATNYALKKAQGEFVALMDSDDISHPDRLMKQVNFLKNNPDVIVVGCQADIINESGEVIGKKRFPLILKKSIGSLQLFTP